MEHDDATPTHAPSRGGKLEKDGRLYLPNAHPLVNAPQGSVGKGINGAWHALNYALRGLYGTGVEWAVSWLDLALEYPRVAVVFVMTVGVLAEETMNDQPLLEGTFRYILYSIDEDAAETIFPPEADPSEADIVIEKLAAEILTKTASDYYDSPEYAALEAEVRAKMHMQVTDVLYQMSGLPREVPMAVEAQSSAPVPVGPEAPEASEALELQ